MKTLKFYIAAIVISLFTTSCEETSLTENSKDIELLKNNMLKFRDQATFEKYVKEERIIENFYSLNDNFSDAISGSLV